MKEVYDFLKKSGAFFIATEDGDQLFKKMYSAEDDNTEVLYFKNAKATFYSFTEEPKIVEF